ncbi:hypothetical protein B0H11DRAFT_1944810 [Mycena galericulata]|nr:hypothetical protein B0H11DRAFT_1944810 [Mycena galericulata]
MAALPPAGESHDFRFNEPEFDHTPSPPPITFQNVTPAVQTPVLHPMPLLTTWSAPPVRRAEHYWQTILLGRDKPTHNGPSKHAPRRCAVCVKNYCVNRFDCPGRGAQKLCSTQSALGPNTRSRRQDMELCADFARWSNRQVVLANKGVLLACAAMSRFSTPAAAAHGTLEANSHRRRSRDIAKRRAVSAGSGKQGGMTHLTGLVDLTKVDSRPAQNALLNSVLGQRAAHLALPISFPQGRHRTCLDSRHAKAGGKSDWRDMRMGLRQSIWHTYGMAKGVGVLDIEGRDGQGLKGKRSAEVQRAGSGSTVC